MEKKCSDCNRVRDISFFYKQKNGYVIPRCDDCRKLKQKEYVRKYRYQLSQEQYEAMLESQNHSCAVCNMPFGDTPLNRPNVDHDHICCPGKISCGKCVRGLICSVCNTMAGAVENNLGHVSAMLEYLTFHLNKLGRENAPAESIKVVDTPWPNWSEINELRNEVN